MIDVVGDHLAAYLLKVAKESGERGVLRLSSVNLLSALLQIGDWTGDDNRTEKALSILTKIGVAKSSNDVEFYDRFYRIDYSNFEKFIIAARKEYQNVSRVIERGDGSRIPESPTHDLLQNHRFLERYYDFGDEWLLKRIEALEDDIGDRYEPFRESNSPRKMTVHLDEAFRDRLLEEISIAETAISIATLSNQDKAQGMGYLIAIKALAEVPEPPADVIWELVNRASAIAGIASLLVSIVALFK